MGEVYQDHEDWDCSKGDFSTHMLAGSMAGVAEHTVVYPLDTWKTWAQCTRVCPKKGHVSGYLALERLLSHTSWNAPLRLWRGVSTMFYGCIPAHALYFSVLEQCKAVLADKRIGPRPLAAAISGGMATVFHDAIMTPMDVIKQRLQLGYYRGMLDCANHIYTSEGFSAFYRSFPMTLFMNIPFGCIMVSMNECLKNVLQPDSSKRTMSTFLLAGSGAGSIAALLTTPLDVVKTKLQTQVLHASHLPAQTHSTNPIRTSFGIGIGRVNARPIGMIMHSGAKQCVGVAGCMERPPVKLVYRGVMDAAQQILKNEGPRGFFKGALPKLLVHTPGVAVSWTTYEMCSRWLNQHGYRKNP